MREFSHRAELREQTQSHRNKHDPARFRRPLAVRQQPFGTDGHARQQHRAPVHDADREQRRGEARAAADAVQAEPPAVAPGRRHVGTPIRDRNFRRTAAGQPAPFPRAELQQPGEQQDDRRRHRRCTCQRRGLHQQRRERGARRMDQQPQQGPDREIREAGDGAEPSGLRVAGISDSRAVAPQRRRDGRQHHREHHRRPHRHECRIGIKRALAAQAHPDHVHAPAARHGHGRHVRHRHAAAGSRRDAGDRQQHRDRKETRCARCPSHGRNAERREGRVAHRATAHGAYSSWRRHQMPCSLRPSGARSSHWYMPQRPSSPRA